VLLEGIADMAKRDDPFVFVVFVEALGWVAQ